MPSLTTWAAFCPCGQWYPRDQNKHTAAPVKVARQQTTREPSGTFATLPHQQAGTFPQSCLRNLHQHTPELSASGTFQDLLRQPAPAYTGTLQNLPEPSGTGPQNRTYTILHRNSPEPSGTSPEPTPAYAGTLRNLPEPASGTYTSIRRNFPEPSGTRLQNLHQHTPELSGTFRNGTLRNLPEPASGTYTSIRRNFQEPSGTPLRNLQQHTTEPSGTFRNLPPEPAPATRTGTHRSLSGPKTPLAYAVGEKNILQSHNEVPYHTIPLKHSKHILKIASLQRDQAWTLGGMVFPKARCSATTHQPFVSSPESQDICECPEQSMAMFGDQCFHV